MQDPDGGHPPRQALHRVWRNLALPLAACAAATALGVTLRDSVLPVNLVLMYLLLVVSITIRIGRSAGMVSSLLSVALYDLFLVPPYGSLAVHDPQHVFTFALILTVAVITSYLAEAIRRQERLAHERARQTEALRAMSAALAGAGDLAAVCKVGTQGIARLFDSAVAVLIAQDGRLAPCPIRDSAVDGSAPLSAAALRIATTVMNSGAGGGTSGVYSAGMYYLALRAAADCGGVLAVAVPGGQPHFSGQSERLLHVAAGQLAMAVERIAMAARAQTAQSTIDAERFRSSVLAAVSHDLRTPLTALTGLASQLVMAPDRRTDLEASIQRVTQRMKSMVSNLLEMARFSQGTIQLQRDWHLIDEVIGSAIAQQRDDGFALPIGSRSTRTPRLVEFDAVLIERVLWNLIENVRLHAHGATRLTIRAGYRNGRVMIVVRDDGCGVAANKAADVAVNKDSPSRDAAAARNRGSGLGLAICRAIVEAHGGSLAITAARRGGTTVLLAIPATVYEDDDAEDAANA